MKVREVLAAWAIAVVPIIALAGSASALPPPGGGGGGSGPDISVAPGNSGTTPGVDKGVKKGWDKPSNPHYAPDNGDGSGGSGSGGGGAG